jgi:hypothetical protein
MRSHIRYNAPTNSYNPNSKTLSLSPTVRTSTIHSTPWNALRRKTFKPLPIKPVQLLRSLSMEAVQRKNVPDGQGKTSFIRYAPGHGLKQRVIKMSEVAEYPLEPPRFRHKKIPRGSPSPPPPVLRSPPCKATATEQKEWMIPPCISNRKNNKCFGETGVG